MEIPRHPWHAQFLINRQHQRGRTAGDRASHDCRSHGRVHGNQYAASGRDAELREGLLRDGGLKVLRIDKPGRHRASVPQDL